MAFPLWLGILADGRTNIPPKTFVSRKLRLLFPPSLLRPLSKEPQRAGISAHVLRAYDRGRVSDVPWHVFFSFLSRKFAAAQMYSVRMALSLLPPGSPTGRLGSTCQGEGEGG